MKPEASFLVSGAFVFLAVLVAGLFVTGLSHASGAVFGERSARRAQTVATLAVTAWMAGTWAVAESGLLSRFDARPPPLALLLGGSVLLGLGLGFSSVGARLALGLPLVALVGAQAFRLPLELAMHQAAREGIMPVRMSFAGSNFDVITGATAVILALLLGARRVGRGWVVVWNALGIVTLVNVLVLAARSTPMVHAYGTAPGQLNTFVAEAPFVWLPSVLVVAAILGHVVITRRVYSQ